MKKGILVLLMLAAVLAACAKNERDFESRIENGQLVLIGYTGNGGDVVIPSRLQGKPVAVIGNEAFREKHLTNITIPKSVTSIGEYAFAENSLISITIPDSVTTIGDFAFGDNQLTSLTIPKSVTAIGEGVFYDNQLTSVTIPDSVTTIGNGAFGMNQITSVTIGANVDIGQVHYNSNTNFSFLMNVSDNSAFRDIKLYECYNDNGKKAGTYTLNGNDWNYTAR
jgi:hypothetical protein